MSILLVEKNGDLIETAVMIRDRLYAYRSSSGEGICEGQIYTGIVDRVLQGVNAVFIRLPDKAYGFLPFEKGQKAPPSGTKVIVQVKRPPNQTKKALLSTDIALGGVHLVYLPMGQGVHVSSRLQDNANKAQLKEIGYQLLPSQGGIILRSAALGIDVQTLSEELKRLIDLWREIFARSSGTAPAMLWSESDPIAASIGEEQTRLEYILTNAPQSLPAVLPCPVKNSEHPFMLHSVRHKLEKSLHRTVQMKSGATLVVDPCEAMTVIDVNSAMAKGGKNIAETAEKINTEAAWEIARLLRLRRIGGMIVVDFIDMDSAEANERLLCAMRQALLDDPVKTTVHDMTVLGLMELTRQRKDVPLSAQPDLPCPHCGGTGILFSYDEEDAANA